MADVAELIVALKLRDGLSGGLGNLNKQLKGMQGGLTQVGRGVGQVGRGLDQIVTRGAIAAAAGIGAVVTAAVSFEDAFAGVRKTVDASEEDFGKLEFRLREMARTMPISFQELAGITEAGGALGVAFEGLDEFTDTVAKLATTTDLSADQAATSLGVLGNVLNLRAEDFDNFGSALVDLGNKGASTESQIIGIAERAGAAGQLIGLSADQVLGFGAAAANMGIEAEAGGSALQRFFIGALESIEGGGEELETFARVAGKSASAFQKAFREDAGEALFDFIEGLGELPQAVQIETLKDLGFNDVRISRLLLGLAGDADKFRAALDISAKAFAENSALGEEAAKRFATTASQLKILKNNVTDAAVVIGEQLLPVVGELTTDLVEFLNKPETRANIKEFGENLAGGIRSFADELRRTDFGPLIDTMKGAAAIAKGAFDAFRSLPAPIQQLALAAIVANKVSGGAVGSIARGLANILTGSLKIAFAMRGSSPANPLWVQQVGGGLGGGQGGRGGRGGRGRVPFLGAGLGAAGLALTLTGSSNVDAEMENRRIQLARDLDKGIIDAAEAARLWAEAYGKTVDNPFVVGARARGGSFAPHGVMDPKIRTVAVLPDTAMMPLTTELQRIEANTRDPAAGSDAVLLGLQRRLDLQRAIMEKQAAISERARADTPPKQTWESYFASITRSINNLPPKIGFKSTIKLDPSQVRDIRDSGQGIPEKAGAIIAHQIGGRLANLGRQIGGELHHAMGREALKGFDKTAVEIRAFREAQDADRVLLRTANTELARNRADNAAKQLGISARISTTNVKLDTTNARLAAIAAKNFSPIIRTENRISNTVIQTSIVAARALSGSRPRIY